MISVIFVLETGKIDSIIRNVVVEETLSLRERGRRIIYFGEEVDPDNLLRIEDGKPVLKKTLKIDNSVSLKDATEITFYRDEAGLGDLVTTLGAVQDVADEFPLVKINYVARSPISDILKNHPCIDKIIHPYDFLETDNPVIRFGNPCPAAHYENNNVPHVDKNRIEIFKLATGLGNSETLPKIYLTEDEIRFGKRFVGDLRVGVVYKSSSKWRDYPEVENLLVTLDNCGYEPLLIDDVVSINKYKTTTGMKIREIASVINALDVIVTPDTGWMHIASALGKKMVTLFGSIDPNQRVDLYDSIDLVGGCPYNLQPCWYDICDSHNKFMPCMSIELEKIVNVVLERLS